MPCEGEQGGRRRVINIEPDIFRREEMLTPITTRRWGFRRQIPTALRGRRQTRTSTQYTRGSR